MSKVFRKQRRQYASDLFALYLSGSISIKESSNLNDRSEEPKESTAIDTTVAIPHNNTKLNQFALSAAEKMKFSEIDRTSISENLIRGGKIKEVARSIVLERSR